MLDKLSKSKWTYYVIGFVVLVLFQLLKVL